MIDEFISVSPIEKKLVDIYRSLQPYEVIMVEADKDGKIDRAWVKRESRFMLNGAVVNFTKL